MTIAKKLTTTAAIAIMIGVGFPAQSFAATPGTQSYSEYYKKVEERNKKLAENRVKEKAAQEAKKKAAKAEAAAKEAAAKEAAAKEAAAKEAAAKAAKEAAEKAAKDAAFDDVGDDFPDVDNEVSIDDIHESLLSAYYAMHAVFMEENSRITRVTIHVGSSTVVLSLKAYDAPNAETTKTVKLPSFKNATVAQVRAALPVTVLNNYASIVTILP